MGDWKLIKYSMYIKTEENDHFTANAIVMWFIAAVPAMCWGNSSYQIRDKMNYKLRRADKEVSLLTQLSEIILYAAPWVFSDKGLDQSPWLLLVLHISGNPKSTTTALNATDFFQNLKKKSADQMDKHLP